MDLCLVAAQRPELTVTKQWVDQDRLDLEGMWTAARETEQTEGEEETDGTDMETY